tara:strand:- start:1177 stop:1374 length:198 start_codon:yes stop_codon:yes gene_type:complete
MVTLLPVVFASDQSTIPFGGSITAEQAAINAAVIRARIIFKRLYIVFFSKVSQVKRLTKIMSRKL